MRTSVVTAPWLQSTGSVVVLHGVSCSMACRIFPDQGSDERLLHWQADSSDERLLHWQADSLPPSHHGSPYLLHSAKWVYTKVLSVARRRGRPVQGWEGRLEHLRLRNPAFFFFFLTCWFKLPALIGQESTNVETAKYPYSLWVRNKFRSSLLEHI